MKSILKTLSLATCFSIAATFIASAQEAAPVAAPAQNTVAAPSPADNPNAPEITFEKELHDYGTIKQGADGNCEFKFKNTGKEPLIITNARGSCGCTVPTYPKEPIMKGQTGVIKVHYDTKRVGAFTKTVTLNSNAKSEVKTLTIKGVVEATEEQPADQATPFKKTGGMPLENTK